MNISDNDLRVGLFYIQKNECGYTDALNVINKGLSEYFGLLGWINRGIDAVGHGRYHITDEGRQYAKLLYISLATKLYKEDKEK